MPRTIHEIDIPRRLVGAAEVVGKIFVEEPVGSEHDPIHAAEAAEVARKVEGAILAVLAAHPPAAAPSPQAVPTVVDSLLKDDLR